MFVISLEDELRIAIEVLPVTVTEMPGSPEIIHNIPEQLHIHRL